MNPNTIKEFAASFQKSRILLSGFELDIFTNVDESGTTNNQIANNLHLDEHSRSFFSGLAPTLTLTFRKLQ
jgi:hypothetical protein